MRRSLQALSAILIVVGGLLATTATAQPYSQSPYLDQRVASGELPPIEERLPETPMVYPVTQEIGVHGGQFNVFAIDNFPWNALTEEPARGPLALLMTQDNEFIPDIVLDFEQAEDFMSFTLHLRPGMKWSNGDPFTSADFTFKREYLRETVQDIWNDLLYPPDATVEAVDDYTVILHYTEPRPRTLLDLIHWRGGEWTLFHPSNYMSQWIPEFNEDAEALAEEEGFATWQEALTWHYNQNPLNDTNKPTSHQWMPVEFTTTARLYERNPYFHQVDAAGQQLPYVDTVLSQIVDPESFEIKVVSGEADLAFLRTNMENFTLYKESEEAANIEVTLLPSFTTCEVCYFFNYSHPDPVRRELYHTAEFRQALSIAIDREEINDLIFNGFAQPQQFSLTHAAPIYEPEWGTAWAQFDPDLANTMLDDLGLTERDSAGIRLDSAGNPIVIVVEYTEGSFSGAAVSVHELVKEYWGNLGIQMEIRPMGIDLSGPRRNSLEWDVLSAPELNGEMYGTILRDELIGFYNSRWDLYRLAEAEIASGIKTLEDFEGGVLPGEAPPAAIADLLSINDAMKRTVFGGQQYENLTKAYFRELADQVYAIGTVGQNPLVFIARPNIGNLPTELPPWVEWGGDLNHYSNQWFFRPEE